MILTALMSLWLVLSGSALAAPSLAVPLGWDAGASASPQAQARADAWAKAWDAQIMQVMSTRSDDDFAETLAILDAAAPIPAEALAELEDARAWLEPRVSAALGSTATLDAEALELLPRPEPGVAVLVGRARQGDRVAWIAMAPQGARHLVVVLLVPAAEEILYTNVFDDAVVGLDRLQAPVAPLHRGPLRWSALVAWLLVGGAVGLVWTRRSLSFPGARVAGRQVALVLLLAAALVLVIARLWLADAAVELALAGGTPWGLAFELAMGGAVAAALVLGVTELWARRLQPVASAPREGSFARTGAAPHRRAAPELAEPITQPIGAALLPAVTGDTQIGPAPTITGDTQVGPAPAITGNTKIGPAPRAISIEELEAGPPVREIISGDIEVQTQIRRMPDPDTVKTTPPDPPEPDTVKTPPPASPVPSLPAEPPRRLPKIEIDWS